MPINPIPLAKVAEQTGFTMSDVAFLTGLNESTLSRLWDDPNWLNKISGKSLQAIVSAVPRVGEYLIHYSLCERRATLIQRLTEHGVTVDCEAFKTLIKNHGVSEQYLSNALSVAIPILNGDVDRSAATLARFWGRDQDTALSYLIGTSNGPRLLLNPQPLITAAVDILNQLATRTNSFHAIIGQAALIHHLARISGNDIPLDMSAINRQTALAFRSLMIGRIISTNDLDLADRYCTAINSNRFVATVEEWSFPTYMNDARMTHDFSLPRSLVLSNTSHEILREIGLYGDAYLYYLMTMVIPAALRRDPSFGGHLPALRKAITARIGAVNPAVRCLCAGVLKQLDSTTPTIEEPHHEYRW